MESKLKKLAYKRIILSFSLSGESKARGFDGIGGFGRGGVANDDDEAASCSCDAFMTPADDEDEGDVGDKDDSSSSTTDTYETSLGDVGCRRGAG